MRNNVFVNALAALAIAGLFHGCSESNSVSPGTNGTGGSLARFVIGDNYLYTLDNNSLRVFDISEPDNPVPGAKISVGTGIETLFPYQDKLFIGSRSGMLIYDNQKPSQPTFLSRYAHVESCDPVVVQGDYAYVTLRDGNFCRGGANLLDVVDIRNPQNPVVIQSIPMRHPHGLGVDGKDLFVSEGTHGLKVFNLKDPRNPVQTQFITGVKTYDVIPLSQDKVLLVTGQDGLYQYDYRDSTQLKLLSKIPIAY